MITIKNYAQNILDYVLKRIQFLQLGVDTITRDANFYALPVVITENCQNFQISTDYGKLEFFYGKFLQK